MSKAPKASATVEPDDEAVRRLEQRLGHRFGPGARLMEALTHPTYANEDLSRPPTYERLEFLGDAVLDLLASQSLMERWPSAAEGILSRGRARLVCQDGLAAVARELGLGDCVRLGRGQAEAGPNATILADVLEAVFGALFLDGGLSACKAAFAQIFAGALSALEPGDGILPRWHGTDVKTALQERCHRGGYGPPRYTVTAAEGPAHARLFAVRLELRGAQAAPRQFTASGPSIKAAERLCAEQALVALGVEDGRP